MGKSIDDIHSMTVSTNDIVSEWPWLRVDALIFDSYK